MKTMILAVAVLCTPAAIVLGGQPVQFADPNLKTIIEKTLGVPDPTAEDMLKLTRLYASSLNIADLKGLEHARNMTTLCVHRNGISDLSPLADLKDLNYLCIHDNQVEDISALRNLTSIVNLLLYGNKIADLSPVANLTEMTSLYGNRNRIADISAVAGLTKLRFLDLSDNQIVDVAPVAGLANLTDLRLNSNRVADATPAAVLDRLKTVWIFDNPAALPAKWTEAQISVYVDAAQYADLWSQAQRGKLACKGEINNFLISRANCFIRVRGDAGEVALPAGEYRLTNWEIEKSDDEGAKWKVTASLRSDEKALFTIAENQTHAVEVGEPLAAGVTATKGRSGYSFSHTLSGRLGESVSLTRDGIRVPPPTLNIKNKDGDYDQTFKFEYG